MDARGDAGEVRPPTPQKRGPSGLPLESPVPAGADEHVEHADTERRDEPRRGMLRRRPFAFVGGLIVLFLALPAGYLYWDYASHFESTDDAFIAARQFTIAPNDAPDISRDA